MPHPPGLFTFRQAILLSLLACAACATWDVPFTQPATNGPPGPDRATVVFAWPSTSCDPGGYYVLATSDGRFVGDVATGTQLRANLPPGETTILGWNPVQEESRAVEPATVPVLHAKLLAGRTYTVRLAFGEWDDRGPRQYFSSRWNSFTTRRCAMVSPAQAITSSLVSLTAGSEPWLELRASAASLKALAPDQAGGQAWLDGHREVLEAHRAVAEARFARLRPDAQRLGTIEPGDGAP